MSMQTKGGKTVQILITKEKLGNRKIFSCCHGHRGFCKALLNTNIVSLWINKNYCGKDLDLEHEI